MDKIVWLQCTFSRFIFLFLFLEIVNFWLLTFDHSSWIPRLFPWYDRSLFFSRSYCLHFFSRKPLFHNGIRMQWWIGFINRISARSNASFEVFGWMWIDMDELLNFLENEIDGSVLLKLSESMVARLFPTIKLEVQFLELLQQLKQQHSVELNSKKPLPPPSLITSRSSNPQSSFENGHDRSSNSNSPTNSNNNNNTHSATKVQKREPKHFLNQ